MNELFKSVKPALLNPEYIKVWKHEVDTWWQYEEYVVAVRRDRKERPTDPEIFNGLEWTRKELNRVPQPDTNGPPEFF